MKKHLFSALLLCAAFGLSAQKEVPYLGKIDWLSGYSRALEGENINYFSAFPDDATVALLTRCTDGRKVIEWETALAAVSGPYVYFSWVAAHSSGTSSGIRNFDLYLDGEKLLTFTTYPAHQRPNWSYAAADSSRLVFVQTKRDGANDAHGLAYLRVPASRVTPGKPFRLKVVGQAQNSNDWYMTFKFSFEEKVEATAMPFVLKNGMQLLRLTALHFGPETEIMATAGRAETRRFTLREGVNTFDLAVPAVQRADSVRLLVQRGGKTALDKFIPLQPVIHREIHLIHHSHTDIGYSHMQPEVVRIHNKNIDDALAMIEATKSLPQEARFKWNVESLWAVENYLEQANAAQKERFLRAVKSGSICLSALYANMLTGMSQPEEMFHYTDLATKLHRQYGLTFPSAMISDVPGATWTTVTALASGGVRYFSSGPNYLGDNHPYGGDRVGHFVKTWGDKPVWWQSPSGGEKLLFWTAGKGYSSWHGTAPGAVFDRGPKKIAAYLNELAAKKYPYEMVQWRYNIVADNGPIDTTISRFVAEWNEKYQSPRLILNTTDSLFAVFERRYGSKLPTVKGDITPYWEDGAQSTAEEEGRNRTNSLRLQQLTTLYAMLRPEAYPEEDFYQAWKNIILFHEHTWGAHNSISSPDVPFVTEQWRIKKQFMLDAEKQIEALEKRLLDPYTDANATRVAVINTSSWPRSGLVTVRHDDRYHSIKDLTTGQQIPMQALGDGRSLFRAENVPAFGTAYFELSEKPSAPLLSVFALTDSSFSNGLITATWDKQLGSVAQLRDARARNVAGRVKGQGLNSYWYVPGLDPAAAQTNGPVEVEVLEDGPWRTRVALRAAAPGARSLNRILGLEYDSDLLWIENVVDKTAIREKEGLHFGYPFAPALRDATLDAGYGTMRYRIDQLPGSNMDYLCGRRWLDASSARQGVQWLLLETPLVEPAEMIDERRTINDAHKAWKKIGAPTSTWFSYAMNNYWHTNYKADQEGVARFHFALRPHGRPDAFQNEKTAMEYTQPLIALPIKEKAKIDSLPFYLASRKVSVTCVIPKPGGGWTLRLFNPEPTSQSLDVFWYSKELGRRVKLKPGSVMSWEVPKFDAR